MATAIVTTADMCNLGLVFRAVRSSHLPNAAQLRTVGSLETYRELTLGQFRDRLQKARLNAFCMGRAPTRSGQPRTSRATCDAEVYSL